MLASMIEPRIAPPRNTAAPVTDAAVPAIAPIGSIAIDCCSGEVLEFSAVKTDTSTNQRKNGGTPSDTNETTT